jgi:phage terminase large subunit
MTSAGISVIPEFRQKIDLDGMINQFIVTQTDIINKFSGSEILFRGIKTSSGNQTANLKSIQGLTTFVGDEMEEWQSEDEFDTLRLSIRQQGIQNRVILIMNPSNAEHFVYKKYIQDTHKLVKVDGVDVQISTHPDVLHIHTSYLDNVDHLAPQFLQEVAELKRKAIADAERAGQAAAYDEYRVYSQARYDSAYQNSFNKSKYAYKIIGRWADIAEGVILPNWEEGEFDTSLPYCYGQDYGFSVDPTTLVKVAVDKKAKRIYVDEEYYSNTPLGTTAVYHVNKSRIARPDDLIVGDSAEDRLISDLQELGLNIIECEKGPGSVTAGLSALQDYTIVVTPQSSNVKRELKNYQWNDKKAGIPLENGNDHTIDPIRYAFRKLVGEQPAYESNLESLSIF